MRPAERIVGVVSLFTVLSLPDRGGGDLIRRPRGCAQRPDSASDLSGR
jgi:hypothetical protein